ncbi:replication/maintenance protein RepL [Dorea sp. AGR2135]|uniref:replication/maintenance protein RepL n=1 Tax=Dorea sp. AGR2135 TaxID=1280669 RepID=UPI0004054FBE|nr:replication/maintenance protein RepL [Dorea sp. AGR2135]
MEKKTKFTTNDKNRSYIRFNKNYLMDIAESAHENPSAFEVFMFIIKNMDANNSLVVSMETLEKTLVFTRSDLNKAIKYLEENKWLSIRKQSTSNVYTINPEIARIGGVNPTQYCPSSTPMNQKRGIPMPTYEVAFVVQGYVANTVADIGPIECNGLQKDEHHYYLKDGRMYYNINATSPEKAYALGRQLFENEDFKDLTVTDWCLEHVSFGDKYWYKEDLHE